MNLKKRILVAPLNWGLGHATRCMPIINALIAQGFEVILASDGSALELLKKEFPTIETVVLPSYNITYPKNKKSLKTKLLKDSFKILQTIKAEKKATKTIVKNYNISGIISDNRFGVRSNKTPSVYITHQINVLSGNLTWLSSKMHQNIIKKYDECWIPDNKEQPNLSGKLGHTNIANITIKYIGLISRFNKQKSSIKYDLMVLLSGPEPQRAVLEKKLLKDLNNYKGKVIFIKGIVEFKQEKNQRKNITIYNFMKSKQLEKAINESQIVLSRSGYTTIMDLAKLNKKAFFIPTPGQFEQGYLAKRLQNLSLVPYCKQEDFNIEKLKQIENFKGFKAFENKTNYKDLFSLFEGK
jgi:uncharacterized protein (TIGR00661 family)